VSFSPVGAIINTMGKVVSVNISEKKGTPKSPTDAIELAPDLGVKGDAHAGPGERQVSLLMEESIERAKKTMEKNKACDLVKEAVELVPGTFAENITTTGIDLLLLSRGDELMAGSARLRITKIGKDCHRKCSIYYKVGDCIMPAEGVFAEVVTGGTVMEGDEIEKC